jgi:spermidine synthase
LDGTCKIAEFHVPQAGKVTLHADLISARNTISKVRILEKEYGVRVILAHDVSWMREEEEEEDGVLISLLDEHMVSARERILHGGIP